MSPAPLLNLPRLYAVADRALFAEESKFLQFIEELVSGGATLLQYRNKFGSPRQLLADAFEMKRRLGDSVRLIMNDRADLCVMAEFGGVHVGQEDLSPEGARNVIGPNRILGVSTHNPEQLRVADQTSADYLAIGPVFATSSKLNPDPMVGLEGVRAARSLTGKPLVAIGGITRKNCQSVIEAGADSVAVISALLRDPRNSVQDFLGKLS